jgi:peptidyl-prolyl cis-trans isomerase SurA
MLHLRRLTLVTACAAGSLAAQGVPPAAAAASPKPLPIDRIVGIVGTHPILYSEVLDVIYALKADNRLEIAADSAGQMAQIKDQLDRMIDEEVLINVAKQYKIEVADADVSHQIDDRMKTVRANFKTEIEYHDALKKDGFGNDIELRRFYSEQAKRDLLQQRATDSLRAHGRLSAPVSVTEEEVSAEFAKIKDTRKRPATISFRQIVVPPQGNPAELKAALDKALAIREEVMKKGVDFAQVAKRESMDPGTKELGGDLGWNRRGVMLPEFDAEMFRLPPGVIGPIVQTSFGFHIIKVDRIQPAEVKARHILIVPALDSNDVKAAHMRADSVLMLWKAGTPYDTLVMRYHDNAELKSYPEAFPIEKLPPEYQKAIEGLKPGDFAKPFEIPNPVSGKPKIVVFQLTARVDGGDYTLNDMRELIKSSLVQTKQVRRMLDQLKKEQYVSVRLK